MTTENDAPSFSIRAQYIKDLSFESPNAPHSLFSQTQPELKVSVDIKAQKLQDDVFESVLKFNIRSKAEGTTLFLAELEYGGVFQISNVPDDMLEPLLMVDCAFLLFPFARRVLAYAVLDGGFPPLMLEPIDFSSLYMQNLQARGQQK